MPYFKMNNDIFDCSLTTTQLKVAAVLYSLVYKSNYSIKVRQSVIAEKCGLKTTQAVGRAIEQLCSKGIVLSKERKGIQGGFLGTYKYTLKPVSKKGYFCVDCDVWKKHIKDLTGSQARMYLYFCKCARTVSKDFWNSFNDIADKLKIARNDVVKTIKELVEKNVICRYNTKNKNGSYNDNVYTINSTDEIHSLNEAKERCIALIKEILNRTNAAISAVTKPYIKKQSSNVKNTHSSFPHFPHFHNALSPPLKKFFSSG